MILELALNSQNATFVPDETYISTENPRNNLAIENLVI